MRLSFTAQLAPTVTLGDYHSLRIDLPQVEATEEEIAAELEGMRQKNAVLEPITDRAAQAGDVLTIDVVGYKVESEELVLKDSDVDITLEPESAYPVPGFHEALVGIEAGEERTFSLPDPNTEEVELEFTVKVYAISERILPDIDDDLARTAGSWDSLEEMRQYLQEQIVAQKQRRVMDEYETSVIDAVVEMSQVEYPPAMLESSLDDWQEYLERTIQQTQQLDLTTYLEKVVGQTIEEWRTESRPKMATDLEHMLVLTEVIEAEEIQVSVQDITEHLGVESLDQIDADNITDVANKILTRKATDRLIAIASGQVEQEEEQEEE